MRRRRDAPSAVVRGWRVDGPLRAVERRRRRRRRRRGAVRGEGESCGEVDDMIFGTARTKENHRASYLHWIG